MLRWDGPGYLNQGNPLSRDFLAFLLILQSGILTSSDVRVVRMPQQLAPHLDFCFFSTIWSSFFPPFIWQALGGTSSPSIFHEQCYNYPPCRHLERPEPPRDFQELVSPFFSFLCCFHLPSGRLLEGPSRFIKMKIWMQNDPVTLMEVAPSPRYCGPSL